MTLPSTSVYVMVTSKYSKSSSPSHNVLLNVVSTAGSGSGLGSSFQKQVKPKPRAIAAARATSDFA